MFGKCPSCGTLVTYVQLGRLSMNAPGMSLEAVSCNCPSCNAILGCQIDPLALKAEAVRETVERVVEALRRPGDESADGVESGA